MEQELGRSPSEIELAEEMKIDCKEIKSMLSHIGRPISMDAPLTNEDNSNLYDILLNEQSDNPEDKLIKESLCKEIERSFNQLNSREAETLKLFFGLNNKIPLSLDEIADHFDLTRERVRQIKEKALRKIRNSSKNKLLRSYLG